MSFLRGRRVCASSVCTLSFCLWRVPQAPCFIFSDDGTAEYVILACSFHRSAQISQRSSFCSSFGLRVMSLAFSFLLLSSAVKIQWQTFLLMLISSDNIRAVIWRFFENMLDLLNVLGIACDGWTARARIIFRCLPSFTKTLIPLKHTLHHPTHAVLSCTFQWNFSQASHKTLFARHWRG